MPDLIYEIPTVQLAIYFSLFFVGLTWFGLIFIKPFLRALMGRDPRINDWVGQARAPRASACSMACCSASLRLPSIRTSTR